MMIVQQTLSTDAESYRRAMVYSRKCARKRARKARAAQDHLWASLITLLTVSLSLLLWSAVTLAAMM